MGVAVEYDGVTVLKSLDENGSGDDALAVPASSYPDLVSQPRDGHFDGGAARLGERQRPGDGMPGLVGVYVHTGDAGNRMECFPHLPRCRFVEQQ